jgi:hypothetical protein
MAHGLHGAVHPVHAVILRIIEDAGMYGVRDARGRARPVQECVPKGAHALH